MTDTSSNPRSFFNTLSDHKISLVLPVGAYHIDTGGKHIEKADGTAYFNERKNWGVGLSTEVTPNVDAFLVGYQNSYYQKNGRGDPTAVAGVNYDPVNVDVGPLNLQLGVAAGVAYTAHGSYAQSAPQLSKGKFTAIAGLHAEFNHKPSGLGLEATVIPPNDPKKGAWAMAFSAKYKF